MIQSYVIRGIGVRGPSALRTVCGLAGIFAVGLSSSLALAGGDVWLYEENGALKTGIIEEFPALDRTAGVRVFHADLGVDVDNAIDEPGLRILADIPGVSNLNPNGLLGFTMNRALRLWDGSDFDTIALNRMNIGFEALTATTPLSDVATNGFDVTLDPDGDLHDHYDFAVDASTRVAGIWLLDLTFHFTGLTSSEPVWILFSQDASDADVEAAEAWAGANIPTPGSLALLGLGGLVATRRRR